jgi:predicted CoA-substrate-specific enzyme activase
MITAGVDIGSLSSETVILNNDEILSYSIVRTGVDAQGAAKRCLEVALDNAKLDSADVEAVVATGYGREMVPFSTNSVTEITCNTKGALFLFPEMRTVIDIGGQDSKIIALDREGRVIDFVMNDKCAAGTGRFLEVMAQALEIDLDDLGGTSLKHKKEVVISSMCTVFAESEVISLISQGYAKGDILNGLHQSIANRMTGMARSLRIEEDVILAGGVAKNIGVVKAIERKLNLKLKIPQEPQIVCALGAAICAREKRWSLQSHRRYSLSRYPKLK